MGANAVEGLGKVSIGSDVLLANASRPTPVSKQSNCGHARAVKKSSRRGCKWPPHVGIAWAHLNADDRDGRSRPNQGGESRSLGADEGGTGGSFLIRLKVAHNRWKGVSADSSAELLWV